MNLNQIFNMFARMVTRRAVNWGMNKGIGHVSKRMGGTTAKGKPTAAANKQAANKQARNMRAATKRARQAARITRRMGR